MNNSNSLSINNLSFTNTENRNMKNSFRFSWGFLIPMMCVAFALSVNAQLSSIGGFEGDMPSYWTKGAEPTG
jgi:hypothetical protein